jgi:hypothetical protein
MIHKYRKTSIRKTDLKDALWLAPRLRTEDLIELRSFCPNVPPVAALIDGIKLSDPCWTILGEDNKPIAIFGVAPLDTNLGSVWLLGSGRIKDIQREFLRHSRFWIEELHSKYDVLTNYIYAENTVHLKWLKWLGFTIIRRVENFGSLSLPFYEFIRIKS